MSDKFVGITFRKLILKENISCSLLVLKTEKYTTNIIINIGIESDFNYKVYDDMTRQTICNSDCILLTSFEEKNFGAIGLFPDKKMYCTAPTATIGKLLLDEAHEKSLTLKRISKDENFCINIVKKDVNLSILKYDQPFFINDIKIVGHNCGNTLGSTVYSLYVGGQEIGVGYDLNIKKDNFLDGFNYFSRINTFITNDNYCLKVEEKNADKNDFMQKFIKKVGKNIVFVASFSRLIELLLTIRENVCVVTNINFIDRIKSMIEWAGTSGVEILDMNFLFSKPGSRFKKCVIVLSDYLNYIYLGFVLKQLPDYELIFLNKGITKDVLDVYDFNYKEINETKKKIDEKNETIEIDEKKETKEKLDTFFIKNSSCRRFEKKLRFFADCEFGKVFDINMNNFKIKKEEQQNIAVPENTIIKEDFIFSEQIKIKNKNYCSFLGISTVIDLRSLLEELEVSNLLLVCENTINFQLMKTFVNKKIEKMNIYDSNNTIDIKILTKIGKKYELSNLLQTLQPKYLNNVQMTLGKVQIKSVQNDKGDTIDNLEMLPLKLGEKSFKITNTEILQIKEVLLQNGFAVEFCDKGLNIESNILLNISKNTWVLEGSDVFLMYSIRELLYKLIVSFE
ncbi:cft2 [Ecytonucleospora hepatopenaei]|uniref:Cleavage and polyadenylation specificity factor subunit 2 n=1 Tax=Ecytonucleospora hepatopenaei TaxID=646526 RepID=A0A1W0E5P7_9MICR|nr:cft2 [Ecytonucleospora hepatopenaei]